MKKKWIEIDLIPPSSSPTADSSTTKAAPYSCLAKKELRLLLLLALERQKAKAAKGFFLA